MPMTLLIPGWQFTHSLPGSPIAGTSVAAAAADAAAPTVTPRILRRGFNLLLARPFRYFWDRKGFIGKLLGGFLGVEIFYHYWTAKVVEYYLFEFNSASVTMFVSIIALAALPAAFSNKKLFPFVKLVNIPLAFITLIKAISFSSKWETSPINELGNFFTDFSLMND